MPADQRFHVPDPAALALAIGRGDLTESAEKVGAAILLTLVRQRDPVGWERWTVDTMIEVCRDCVAHPEDQRLLEVLSALANSDQAPVDH